MKAQEFCYWLQGYFEISGVNPETLLPRGIDCMQVQTIQRHLALVFKHEIDPQYGSEETQSVLQHIHDGEQFHGTNESGAIYRC